MAEPSHDRPADIARRRRAAAVAGHLGDATSARSLLTDPDPTVRATALSALARVGDLADHELTAALADPTATVRRRALEVLAGLPDGGAGRPISILPLLADPEATVVETAAWACGEREPPEPEAAAALATLAVEADEPLVREAAVGALGAIGDPTTLPAVLHATGDRATVRRRAVLALAPFDGPEVDAALQRALEDRDWQVRQAAEDLLGHGS
jgi:HEAT repeat protein